MSLDICILEVQKALGEELSPQDKKKVSSSIEKVISDLQKKKGAMALTPEEIMEASIKKGEEDLFEALAKKRKAAFNELAVNNAKDYILENWASNPGEGLNAFLGGSSTAAKGSKASLDLRIGTAVKSLNSHVYAKLEEKGLIKAARGNDFDEAIFESLGALQRKQGKPSHIPQEAWDIASIAHEVDQRQLKKAIDSGASASIDENWIQKRTHDNLKIRFAAGKEIPASSPAHREIWKNFVKNLYDVKGVLPEHQDEVLNNMFEQFSNGYHLNFEGDSATGFSKGTGISSKLDQSRVLVAKDPNNAWKAEYEYAKKFGRGENFLEGKQAYWDSLARDTEIMKVLGPSGGANLERVIDEVAARLHEDSVKNGTENKVGDFKASAKATMTKLWPNITGQVNISNGSKAHVWSQNIRSVQMAKLGGAMLSGLFTDPLSFASTFRYFGDRTTGSAFAHYVEGIKSYLEDIKGPGKARIMSELGIVPDIYSDVLMPDRTGEAQVTEISKWANKAFKMTGLLQLQDRLRWGAATLTSHSLALEKGLSFAELARGRQELLTQHGVMPEHWDAIRHTEMGKYSEGRELLFASQVDQLSDGQISSFLEKEGRPVNGRTLARKRQEIKDAIQGISSSVANFATTHPGARDRAVLNQGLQSGTVAREALNLATQFKTFPVSAIRNHLGREFYGYSASRLPLSEQFKLVFSGKTDGALSGISTLVGMGMFTGYATMAMKDIIKGREPRIPNNPQEFAKISMAALAQSGALSIYGDFLFGEALSSNHGGSALASLLGPTASSFEQLTKIAGGLRSKALGDKADIGSNLFNFVVNHTPGVSNAYNVWWRKPIVDYLIMYRVKEMINPGSLRRMESNLLRDKDIRFFKPPSEVIPYGGGF